MEFKSIIGSRRDGKGNTNEELIFLANGAASGLIPDYQLSAWLMAAYLRPLSEQETAWLTLAMANSGDKVDLSGLPRPWVDKHSTGGVGDKTTIVLLPLLAACGLTVVKMSGRGLGITGGTVDKLSSIPGFRLDLSPEELKDQAGKIGIALTGQTPDLAPADKVLYSLRDSTATVGSIPLIVSSILSKKMAGGAEVIVLDVKCGNGAFMRTRDEARSLATALKNTADLCGLTVRTSISDMAQPLGHSVGNALEVKEAIRTLEGQPGRFAELCVQLAGLTLETCGHCKSMSEGVSKAREALSSGQALEKARQWFLAQGAIVDVIASPNSLPQAKFVKTLTYDGPPAWVETIDAERCGKVVMSMGGGRINKESPIDLSVGVILNMEVGSHVEPNSPLFTVYGSSDIQTEQSAMELLEAFQFSSIPIAPTNALLEF